MADQVKFYKDTYNDANALTHGSSVPNGAIIEASPASGIQSNGKRLYVKDSSGNVHNIGESLGTLNIYHQDTTATDAIVVVTKKGNADAKTVLGINDSSATFGVPIGNEKNTIIFPKEDDRGVEFSYYDGGQTTTIKGGTIHSYQNYIDTSETVGGSGDDGAIYIKDSGDDTTITLDGGNGSMSANNILLSGSMSVSDGAIQLGDDSPFYGAVTIGKSGSSGSVAIKNSSNIGTIGLDGSDGSISAYSIETLGTGGITISNTDGVMSKLEIKPSGVSEQIAIVANRDMFINTDENLTITSKQSTTASPSNKTATLQYGNVRILGDNKTVTSDGSTYKYWDSPIYLQTSGHGWLPSTISNGEFTVSGFGLLELKIDITYYGNTPFLYRFTIPCEETPDRERYMQLTGTTGNVDAWVVDGTNVSGNAYIPALCIEKKSVASNITTFRIYKSSADQGVLGSTVYYRWIYHYNTATPISSNDSGGSSSGGSPVGSGGSGNSGPTPENQ